MGSFNHDNNFRRYDYFGRLTSVFDHTTSTIDSWLQRRKKRFGLITERESEAILGTSGRELALTNHPHLRVPSAISVSQGKDSKNLKYAFTL